MKIWGTYHNYFNLYPPLETQFSEFGSDKVHFAWMMQIIVSSPFHPSMPGPAVLSSVYVNYSWRKLKFQNVLFCTQKLLRDSTDPHASLHVITTVEFVCFIWIFLWNWYFNPHFWRKGGKMTYPRLHNLAVGRLEFKPRSPVPQSRVLSTSLYLSLGSIRPRMGRYIVRMAAREDYEGEETHIRFLNTYRPASCSWHLVFFKDSTE